jgi:XTP/dITP diphosphohydrolase
VEDTSLFIDSLAGFPGSLVKYVSSAELCRMIPQNSKRTALALCLLGRLGNELEVYEGRLIGQIALSPRGKGFGWDDIFIPDGEFKTLAELGEEVKIKKYSMRTKAIKELIGRS